MSEAIIAIAGALYLSGCVGATLAIAAFNPHLRARDIDRRSPSATSWLAAGILSLFWPLIYMASRVCEQLTPESQS